MKKRSTSRDLAFAALTNLVGVLIEEVQQSLPERSKERIDQAVDVLVMALGPHGGHRGAPGLRRPTKRIPPGSRHRLHLPGTIGVRPWPRKGGSASSP